jgi:hypothetical protein
MVHWTEEYSFFVEILACIGESTAALVKLQHGDDARV